MRFILPKRAQFLNVRFFSLLCIVFMAWNIATNQFLAYYVAAYPSEETIYSLSRASDAGAYLDRRCVATGSLEERKRVRWVAFKAEQILYTQSFKLGGYYMEKAAFLALHVALFALTALFAIKSSVALIGTQTTALSKREVTDWCYGLAAPIFGALSLYVFNGHSAEFTFSTIEAFCISAGLYLALKRNVLLFTLVLIAAVLNRESGFIILLVWFAFDGFRRLALPLIASSSVFLLVNLDISACVMKPGFFLSLSHQKGQLTMGDAFDRPVSVVSSMLLNFVFFALVAIAIRKAVLPLVDEGLKSIVNKLVGLLWLYLIVFLVATPLHHMSVKYLLVPFLTVLATLYFVLAIARARTLRGELTV
jgi:hypothetical protein